MLVESNQLYDVYTLVWKPTLTSHMMWITHVCLALLKNDVSVRSVNGA